jgi:hypothetical protein
MRTTGWTRALRAAAFALSLVFVAACGQIYSRSDFTTMVMDKSDDEVMKKVGKPTTVDSSNPEQVTWTYYSETFNVDNQNKRDQKTVVTLKKGSDGKLKVTAVQFS